MHPLAGMDFSDIILGHLDIGRLLGFRDKKGLVVKSVFLTGSPLGQDFF